MEMVNWLPMMFLAFSANYVILIEEISIPLPNPFTLTKKRVTFIKHKQVNNVIFGRKGLCEEITWDIDFIEQK